MKFFLIIRAFFFTQRFHPSYVWFKIGTTARKLQIRAFVSCDVCAF